MHKEILTQLPKAKLQLDRQFSEQISVDTKCFQCVICYQIPADPHECMECNALFCINCIDKIKQQGILVKKCPHCKLQFRYKKISKLFHSLFDNIQFKHDCKCQNDIVFQNGLIVSHPSISFVGLSIDNNIVNKNGR